MSKCKVAHLVVVRWMDANSKGGWYTEADLPPIKLEEIVSVGLYRGRTKDTLQITRDASEHGLCGDPENIPLSQILSVAYCSVIPDQRDRRRKGKYRFSKNGKREPWRIETRKERRARQKREKKEA